MRCYLKQIFIFFGLVILLNACSNQSLSHWQVESIQKGDDAQTGYNHLIVDEASVGSQQWEHMLSKMITLLLDS